MFNLAKRAVIDMCGPDNQNFKCLIVGPTGSGKSEFALGLADAIATELSKRKYNGDNSHWKDYFNPEKDIAIIKEESIHQVMTNATEKHHVYLLDDIASGWSNRKWQSKGNELLNSIFGVQRTYNNAIIATVQSDKFIDCQARVLFNWYIEVTGPHAFSYSINFGKVFKITLHPRDKSNPIHYEQPRELSPDGHPIIYTAITSGLARKEIREYYQPIRRSIVDELAKTKLDSMRGEHVIEKLTKPKTKKEQIKEYVGNHKIPIDKDGLISYKKEVKNIIGCSDDLVNKTLRPLIEQE